MPRSNWFEPISPQKFHVTQVFFAVDPVNYPITKHHPGVDYGTQGATDIPIYFCADGEVIDTGSSKSFGNFFFYYVPGVDRTFVYFHLRGKAPQLGAYKAGQQCGVAGDTGFAQGIHLHLECIQGRVTAAKRSKLFTSADNLSIFAEDPDAFIRARLSP